MDLTKDDPRSRKKFWLLSLYWQITQCIKTRTVGSSPTDLRARWFPLPGMWS